MCLRLTCAVFAIFILTGSPFGALAQTNSSSVDLGGNKGPIDVYIIAGQSNSTGQGYLRNLPPDFKPDASVLLFHSGKPHLDSGEPPLAWAPLHQASESPDRFGPELGFGNRIQELFPNRKIALIKHAHSGTNLYHDWNPGQRADDRHDWGPQFSTFVDTVQAGLKGLTDAGYQPVLRGVLWQQGEGDADKAEAAQDYAKNLSHFIARTREQFQSTHLLFVYGYVLPPPNAQVGRDAVRQAEHDLDQNSGSTLSVPGAFVVETDNLSQRADDPHTPLPNDHLHFGSAGSLELGRRYADKVFDKGGPLFP